MFGSFTPFMSFFRTAEFKQHLAVIVQLCHTFLIDALEFAV